MHKYSFLFLFYLLCLFNTFLNANNRDYIYIDQNGNTITTSDTYCLLHALKYASRNQHKLYLLIPQVGKPCEKCGKPSIYLGYFDSNLKKYDTHFERLLGYSSVYKDCSCYWPEHCKLAEEISDFAYDLFEDLISSTALSSLINNRDQQNQLLGNADRFLDKSITALLIAKQFWFTDYYEVILNILEFSKKNYSFQEFLIIQDKVENILDALYPKFWQLYSTCSKKHSNPIVLQELAFLKALTTTGHNAFYDFPNGKINPSTSNYSRTYRSAHGIQAFNNVLDVKLCRKFLLEQAIFLNELQLYNNAIVTLSNLINDDPKSAKPYVERAIAYFEIGKIDLALQDYQKAKKIVLQPLLSNTNQRVLFLHALYFPENKLEFSKGLTSGTYDGSKEAVYDFIPSVWGGCKGIGKGLWAFVCSPKEVTNDLINAVYDFGRFIYESDFYDCLECFVPEVGEIKLHWQKWDDYNRGKKLGFIIGKYGVEVLAPSGTIKAVSKFRALKRANAICTLEACSISQAKRARIIEESEKFAAIRAKCIETAKKGKLAIKCPNVIPHVMQKKHAWEKILSLTGNMEEDFKKVIQLLEKHEVIHPSNLQRSKEIISNNTKLLRNDYQKTINNHKVWVVNTTYLETNETYLMDAWVITR